MRSILQPCYAILRNAISGAISKSRAAEARAIENALHNRVVQLLVGYRPIIRIESAGTGKRCTVSGGPDLLAR